MKTPDKINGLKIIRFNSQGVDDPDDPSYPYKLVVNLRPPDLMQVAFVMRHGGSEELIVRAMAREAINEFVALNDLHRHPRLRRMSLSGPEGIIEEFSYL